ncbi:MAG: hypothetical protein J3Q66DRAFT_330558 [Benniella sp.]|nr:MAG: hypothetical protein J3Q66DRAFT_330558 [Benniella sp.]
MHFVRSLLVLCSVATWLVHGSIHAVTSRSLYSGEDTTDPAAQETEIFRDPKNHPTAVASIIYHLALQADFHPRVQGVQATSEAYGQFLRSLRHFPEVFYSEETSELNLGGSYEQFRELIVAKYNSGKSKAVDAATAFVDQIPTALGEEDHEHWLLTLAAITRKDDGYITADLSFVPIKLTRDDYGTVSIDRQITYIQQQTFHIASSFLVNNAYRLGRRVPVIHIDAFRRAFTTKSAENNAPETESWSCTKRTPRQNLYSLPQLRLRH